MSKKTSGYILIVIGAILALVGALADIIGIGNQVGAGWRQLLVVVIGFYVSFFGMWLVLNK